MIDNLTRDEDHKFRSRSRSHNVEAIETQQELVLTADGIGIAESERGDHHVALLALEALDGIDSVADESRWYGCAESSLEAIDDECLLRAMRSNYAEAAGSRTPQLCRAETFVR